MLYRIYWGNGNVSCFHLKSEKQAMAIAKQYESVTKVEEVKSNVTESIR